MNAGCAGKTEISRERVLYLSALEVCSRQGAIQIHVYLYFPSLPQTKAYQRLGPWSSTTISFKHFVHPSANFSRGEKSDTLRRFSIPVTLGTPSFRNEKYI